jgi:hypothetical protein
VTTTTTTRQDKTKQDKTRQGKTRQDKTRQDKTRQDKTRQEMTRQDKTRQDKTRQDNNNIMGASRLQNMATHGTTGSATRLLFIDRFNLVFCMPYIQNDELPQNEPKNHETKGKNTTLPLVLSL